MAHMTEPAIAIVTPSLDQAAYLPAALSSVRAPRGVMVDHVVVDAGSRDGTLELLAGWDATPVRWARIDGIGQSAAVNEGIRMTTAPIVGWLNTDDQYVPGAIEAALEAFAGDPLADVVYGSCEIIDEQGAALGTVRATDLSVEDLVLQRARLYQPAFFFRRRVFERVGGLDERLHLVMDHDLFLRLALGARATRLDHVLARHRLHAGAKSMRRAPAFMDEAVAVLDRLFARADLQPPVRALRSRAYEAAYYEGGIRALAAGEAAEGRRRLRAAVRAGGVSVRVPKSLALLLIATVFPAWAARAARASRDRP